MTKSLYDSASSYFTKSTPIEKIFFITLTVVTIYCMSTIGQKTVETMESQTSSQFVSKRGNQIYDEFYANVYDELFFDKPKHEEELSLILSETTPSQTTSKMLEIGSGTGHYVGDMDKAGYKISGIDVSQAMIDKAKENYPTSEFTRTDALTSISYPQNNFTHILCMYFTIYIINDMDLLFKNCMDWLTSDGHLILHLVDRDIFDPTLNIATTTYSDGPSIISHSTIKDYTCKTSFQINGDNATFTETFKNVIDNSDRVNVHEIIMPTLQDIENIAKTHGFEFKSRKELDGVGYEGQYIYIFKKS